jgi:tRNA (guanine37-N1)-methyltransferase
MRINILTIFPDYFNSVLDSSILKRAVNKKLVKFNVVNIRDFAQDKHKTTDARPFSGGPGMVMKIEPIDLALKSLKLKKNQINKKIILLSARGEIYNQQKAKDFSKLSELTLICGHYQDVDGRVAEHLVDEVIRIGDYVLTGGEPAAAVISDSVTRLIPNVLGNEQSNKDESHSQPGKLSNPSYTRPENYKGLEVPKVLLSGDPKKISLFQAQQQPD